MQSRDVRFPPIADIRWHLHWPWIIDSRKISASTSRTRTGGENSMSSASPIIAAKAGAARRAVVSHFTAMNAFAEDQSTSFSPKGLLQERAFSRLLANQSIRSGTPGSYYLDRDALAVANQRRWMLLAALALAASLIFLFGWLST
jgi:hypothetical protein